jgi:hypothetical protein
MALYLPSFDALVPAKGKAEKVLDLPARSRFGEGRAETFLRMLHESQIRIQRLIIKTVYFP